MYVYTHIHTILSLHMLCTILCYKCKYGKTGELATHYCLYVEVEQIAYCMLQALLFVFCQRRYMYMYIYIYIYRERERERKRDVHMYIYLYICKQ